MTQKLEGADNRGLGRASGNRSTVDGGISTATGLYSHAEGTGTLASGSYSHAEGSSTAAGGDSAHCEGFSGNATGQYAHAEGNSCTASGVSSHAEGIGCLAAGTASHAQGRYATCPREGMHGQAAGLFGTQGDAQYSTLIHMGTTTDATPKVLTTNAAAVAHVANATVLTLNYSRVMTFEADIVAHRSDAGFFEGAAWRINGMTNRDVLGVPAYIGTPTITSTFADAAAAAWSVALSIVFAAGTTYYLAFTVTGEASKTIHWVAVIRTIEVG